jgi:hypothetical protein
MAQGFWQTLVTLQAPGTAVAATTTRTSLTVGSTQARYTLPGNALKSPGDQLRLTASGIISTVVTTPGTQTIDFAMATVAVCSTGAMTLNTVAYTNTPWFLDILMTVKTSGTAGNFAFTGFWLCPASVNVALPATGPGPGGQIVPYSGTATGASTTSAGTVDLTVSQLLDLYATQSINTAGSSIQLLQMNISLLTATGF